MFAPLGAFMRKMLEQLLDIAFPPSMRSVRVRSYAPESLMLAPQTEMLCGTAVTTLARYHQHAMEDAIRALKYEKSAAAARLIAGALAEYLEEVLAELSLFSEREVVLVPMPLAPKRERERGYNQIMLVLSLLARLGVGMPIRDDLLMRTKETAPQTRLSRKERLSNVADAFAVRGDASLSGLHIFLIDDVATTGATLTHAARALERSGAKVTALAFAHA